LNVGADDETRTRDIDVRHGVALGSASVGNVERMTRLELATSTLGRSRSTN